MGMEHQAGIGFTGQGSRPDLPKRTSRQICFSSCYNQMSSFFNCIPPMRGRVKSLCLAAMVFAPFCVCAQDLELVVSGASNDLQKAFAELSAVRQGIEAERLPLARQVTELEQKLSERRSEFAKAQRFQENQLVEL